MLWEKTMNDKNDESLNDIMFNLTNLLIRVTCLENMLISKKILDQQELINEIKIATEKTIKSFLKDIPSKDKDFILKNLGS